MAATHSAARALPPRASSASGGQRAHELQTPCCAGVAAAITQHAHRRSPVLPSFVAPATRTSDGTSDPRGHGQCAGGMLRSRALHSAVLL